MKLKRGILSLGALVDFEPDDLDLTLPDDELFKLAVISAANASCQMWRLHEMSQNGRVARNELGRVYISGEGWSIDYRTPDYVNEFQKCNAERDWVKLAAITQFDSFSEFNTHGKTKH